MPKLGETKYGKELGFKSTYHLYTWSACIICNKERWVGLEKGHPAYKRCKHCAMKDPQVLQKMSIGHRGIKSGCWKGGRDKTSDGYITIRLYPNDFFFPMANKSHRVMEHRLVMARYLGRCLHPWEIIHHKNNIRDDNKIENLQLVTDDRHKQITILENRITILEKRVMALEVENILLKEQLYSKVKEVIG